MLLEAVSRAALGQDIHGVEHLQSIDRAPDHIEKHGGAQKRKRNMAEQPEPVGAVDLGGLIILSGDVLQARQENHHKKPAFFQISIRIIENSTMLLLVSQPTFSRPNRLKK